MNRRDAGAPHGGPGRVIVRNVLTAVVSGAVGAAVLAAVFHAEPLRALSDLAQLAAAVSATFACRRAGMRRTGSMRASWWLLATATGSWALGELIWCWYELVIATPAPFPSPADAFFLMSVPLSLVGLWAYVDAPTRFFSRVVGLLEAAIIASGILFVSWLLVLGDVYRSSTGGVLERAVSLAYPLGDCLIVALLLFATTRRQVHDRMTLATLAVGFGAIAAADSTFAVLTQSGSYATGHLCDVGWIVGFAVIAAAATRHEPDGPTHISSPRVRRALLISPFLPLAIGGGEAVWMLAHGRHLDSTAIWISTAIVTMLGAHQFAVVYENDILTVGLEGRVAERTEELARRERRFAGLVENSSDVTFLLDAEGRIDYVSGSATSVLGIAPDELVGTLFADLLDPTHRRTVTTTVLDPGVGSSTSRRIEAVLCGPGTRHVAELTVTNLVDEPALGGIVVNSRDVTERRELEHQLRHDALHDSLTGLANRRLLVDRIQMVLDRRAEARRAAVLMVDLDDFKAVNDTFGHHAGDEFLVGVAERLRTCVRPADTVARLGGDEFAVLLTDTDVAGATATSRRILEVLRLPIEVGGEAMGAPASIGVRCVGGDDTPQMLLRDADIALYAAKSLGKGCAEVFDPDLGERARRRLVLRADLREAWTRGEVTVFYQPIVRVPDGELRGAEALVRWTHPEFGTVSPTEFVPLAEETGGIIDLGLRILRTACERAATWCRSESFSYISVNVSPVQLASDGFLAAIDEVLAETGLDPRNLVLEVTEGVLLGNFDAATGILEALRARGIRTAIDDFGTGYSSLAYAQHLPVDLVKIDRAFTSEVLGATTVIPAIMQIADVLGASVVAEGIETDDQAVAIEALGCGLGQGYRFSPPVPASSFQRFVDEGWVAPIGSARAPSAPSTEVVTN